MWITTVLSSNFNTTGIGFSRCLRPLLMLWVILVASGLAACVGRVPLAVPTSTPPPLVDELIFYNWVDYMPQSVLDAFTAEYGVTVTYLTYESMEEALAHLRAGQRYDVVVLEHDYIQPLAAENLLAEIDHHNLPNLVNISSNFLDLGFDPGNRYTVPYGYGTTGLVVRGDLTTAPVTRWADLWEPRFVGKIVARPLPSELIGVALKALGYPLTSENPQHLEAALQHLCDLKSSITFVGNESAEAVLPLLSGEALIMVGWGNDALVAQQEDESITYVLPAEGTMLWSDMFVIPAASRHKTTAELFMNFLLRPEIGAQIINGNRYATANEAAYAFAEPDILNNSIIFPPADTIKKADWYLPMSPAGEELYADIWQRFLESGP